MPASSPFFDRERNRQPGLKVWMPLALLAFILAACNSPQATQPQAPLSAPVELSDNSSRVAARRMASSPGYCPAGPFQFTMALDGSQFSGKDEAGGTFSAPLAPDGTINVRYRTVGGRSVLITGNAKTGQLQLASGPSDSCRYAFTPATADATASPPAAWRASQSLVGGISRNCGDPPFPTYLIRVSGKTLFADPEDGESQRARGFVLDLGSLRADGSGRVTVTYNREITWHYDFEAGSGARKFHVRRDTGECTYLYQPS